MTMKTDAKVALECAAYVFRLDPHDLDHESRYRQPMDARALATGLLASLHPSEKQSALGRRLDKPRHVVEAALIRFNKRMKTKDFQQVYDITRDEVLQRLHAAGIPLEQRREAKP